jgi:polyhydroxyalkanoate synthesis regulator phasin
LNSFKFFPPSVYALYPTSQSPNALMNAISGPAGPPDNPQDALASSSMQIDKPLKWSTDTTILAVTHSKGCDTCKGYRRHAFEALCDDDEGFMSALEASKKHWAEDADVRLKMEKGRYNALYDEFCELRKKEAVKYDELLDRKDDLRKRTSELEDAEDEIEFLKRKVSDLEAKVASVGKEERARYQALASKGKQREDPSNVAEPMAKRI